MLPKHTSDQAKRSRGLCGCLEGLGDMTGGGSCKWVRGEGGMEVEMDAEGNVSEGRGWESVYDEGAGRGRVRRRGARGRGGGSAALSSATPMAKNGLRSKRRGVRGAEAASTGAGATAAAGASVLPLATTGRSMEKSVRAGLGRGEQVHLPTTSSSGRSSIPARTHT